MVTPFSAKLVTLLQAAHPVLMQEHTWIRIAVVVGVIWSWSDFVNNVNLVDCGSVYKLLI